MPVAVSNPRDLFVLLLGEILHVERRLAGGVLQSLAGRCRDERLRAALDDHLAESRHHVDRVEAVFRRIEVAPSALLVRSFEAEVSQHDELAGSFVDARLADVFHARSCLNVEHWELAAYSAVLVTGEAMGLGAPLAELRTSVAEEAAARDRLLDVIEALGVESAGR